MKYRMTIAGLERDLPLCKVADDLYIGAFVMFGDAEITVAAARELLKRAPKDYDYMHKGLSDQPPACQGPFDYNTA